ncbi:MAG: hypothetical protein KC486_01830 [Myxococcales bacterium]|nr:hypothetical protein [Myxococcales bacterium]
MIGSGWFGKWAQALALVGLAGCAGDDGASTTATTGQGSATATTTAGTSSTGETAGTSTTGDGTSTSTSTGTATSAGETETTTDTSTTTAGLEARPFTLGMTPFPYDVTQEAVDWVYGRLAVDVDLLAFHTTSGVPWVEAGMDASADGYGASVKTIWATHLDQLGGGHEVYVALTPLDDSRSKLADYWAAEEHMPLPAPWDSYDFDAPEVKAAYLSFCRQAILTYEPDHFAIGIEVNLLKANAPERWDAFVDLHSATYTALKAEFPDLPVFATFTGVDLLEGWTALDHAAQMDALADVLPYSDYLGISFYPFMSAYLANPYPASAWDDFVALAGGKPVVIGESGFPAQTTELKDFMLTFEGTPEKQEAFVADMLAAADVHSFPFVVNFLVRDYDALWEAINGGDYEAIWRDTGFYDEGGAGRPALDTWLEALARPHG